MSTEKAPSEVAQAALAKMRADLRGTTTQEEA